jgi:hypothetical protein
MRRLGRFAARLLTERAARKSAEKNNKNEREEDKMRRTHTTAGHKLKRYLAPAQRSAWVEFQRSSKDFHVLESGPILGTQLVRSERRTAKSEVVTQFRAVTGKTQKPPRARRITKAFSFKVLLRVPSWLRFR